MACVPHADNHFVHVLPLDLLLLFRVPLQYLNNCCHWRDMILAVGPGVLIPRPETEMLIDLAQQVHAHTAR